MSAGPWRWLRRSLIATAVMVGGGLGLPPGIVGLLDDGPSVCHGTAAYGWLENGVPVSGGAAARPYCWVCTRTLRTYGDERAVEVVRLAYDALAESDPDTDWVYGESGFPWGGRIRPHKTHRNGLSYDFMVPLKDGARFPTSPWNRFGYDAAFDAEGRGEAGHIDFAAINRHLDLLDRISRESGGSVQRVIFAPDLQDNLFGAPGGAVIRARLRFNDKPSWVRHDDHYHVDFSFPCESA